MTHMNNVSTVHWIASDPVKKKKILIVFWLEKLVFNIIQ